jgi:hypothetical protein
MRGAAEREVGSAAAEEGKVVARVARDGDVEVGEGILGVARGELDAGVLDELGDGRVGGDVGSREGAGERAGGKQAEGERGQSQDHGGGRVKEWENRQRERECQDMEGAVGVYLASAVGVAKGPPFTCSRNNAAKRPPVVVPRRRYDDNAAAPCGGHRVQHT